MIPADHFSQLLALHGQRNPAARALTFLEHGEREGTAWSWAELAARTERLAAVLGRAGLVGKPVLLLHDAGPAFVEAFAACLRAGVVAVPVPAPTTPRNLTRIHAIAHAAGPKAVLATTTQMAQRNAIAGLADLPWIASDSVAGEAEHEHLPFPAGEAPAFLQFTSGSTQTPRGVVVSHGNLAQNLAMIGAAFAMAKHTGDCSLSWLPHYHDMGLIGGLLAPLAFGVHAVFMSPMAFLQKPERWLRAIARYRATITGGPDFAYALCAARATPERGAGLDLSSWRLAFCGAERVRPATLQRFARSFAPAGFHPASYYPCYGLAEATLFVSGRHLSGEMPWLTGADVTALPGNIDCGSGQSGQDLCIVDPETSLPLPDGDAGEIWVAGPHVAGGYWGDAGTDGAVFNAKPAGGGGGRFLRTGDLGTLHAGRLTVLGRMKHVIIVRGAKHQAEDIESTVAGCHPCLAGAAGAAFAVETGAEEDLVVIQEVNRAGRSGADLAALTRTAARAVTEAHGVRAAQVVFVPQWSLPRTTSGKVIRSHCREAYIGGALTVLGPASATVQPGASMHEQPA